MTDNLVVIVQARAGGTRMRGKVLMPLLGQPMLLWQLDRLSQIETPHTLVVACPRGAENQALVNLCCRHGYLVEAPDVPENDVLARFSWVARKYEASEIVRVCGDCPLLDPVVIDSMIGHHRWHSVTHNAPRPDHTGTAFEWPDGQDAEIFSRKALDTAHAQATVASDREHVAPWMFRHLECATLPCPFDLSWQQYSVDTLDNFNDVAAILEICRLRHGATFGWRDIAHAIEWSLPDVAQRMRERVRNAAYTRQVAQERGLAEVPTWEDLRQALPQFYDAQGRYITDAERRAEAR